MCIGQKCARWQGYGGKRATKKCRFDKGCKLERRGEERREKGGRGKVRVARERSEKHGGWKEGAIGEGRWNPEAEGGGFGRARIIFAEEKALPLFVVAEGTEVRIRGGWKIRGEQENDG